METTVFLSLYIDCYVIVLIIITKPRNIMASEAVAAFAH